MNAEPKSESKTENGSKPRFETLLNQVRKEAARIRESNERLQDLCAKMEDHPAPATTLLESVAVIRVSLEHLRQVFREF